MTESSEDPAVAHLADVVIQSYGQIAQVVDHMVRFSAQSPADAQAIPEALRRLLNDVLGPLADRGDVAAAASLLAEATELIGENLFLVPPAAAWCEGGAGLRRSWRRR